MSRRDQITMTTGEIEAFLREQRVVIVASNGADGWPHLMPLWFVVRGDELWAWTYGASQKVKNLERDARATLQIETGEEYQELRGLMIKTRAVVHRDYETVAELGVEILTRYGGYDPARQYDFAELLDLNAVVVSREIHRTRKKRRSGPTAENILRRVAETNKPAAE